LLGQPRKQKSSSGGDDSSSDSSSSSSSSSDSSSDSDANDDDDNESGRYSSRNNKKSDGRRKDKGKDNSHSKNRLFKSLEATEAKAKQAKVTVFKQEKECSVRIVDFNLSNLCRAMKSIISFQEREGTAVKLTKILSAQCKTHLRIGYNVTTTDLINMPLSTLFNIMAQETKVLNKIQFHRELKESLSHIKMMSQENLGPDTHETFYFQQLTLTEDFMMLLRLMLVENKQHCPKIINKDLGLIKLFSSFHPRGYWEHIWNEMTQVRYKTMKEFIDEYEELAMQHYKLSTAFKELPYNVNAKKQSSDKEKKYYDFKRETTKNLNRSSSYPVKDKPKYNSFNNINHEDGCSSDNDGDPNSCWVNAPAEPVASEQASRDKANDSDDSLSQASNETEPDEDEAMLTENLMAFADHNVSRDKKDLACLRKIMSGKCEREDCPYGHKREVLMQGAANMSAKLKAFQDSQKGNAQGNAGPPYKVLQKDKYGAKN
jgi:hypothetical protein